MKVTPAWLSSRYPNVSETTSLDLANLEISSVEDISFCISCRKIDLSKNKLCHGEALNGLQFCSSITWVNLSHNQLSSIEHILKLKNLTVLNLSYNDIATIPQGIAALKNLKALILNDNKIANFRGTILPSSLTTLGNDN